MVFRMIIAVTKRYPAMRLGHMGLIINQFSYLLELSSISVKVLSNITLSSSPKVSSMVHFLGKITLHKRSSRTHLGKVTVYTAILSNYGISPLLPLKV
jgi:hypothetical protein